MPRKNFRNTKSADVIQLEQKLKSKSKEEVQERKQEAINDVEKAKIEREEIVNEAKRILIEEGLNQAVQTLIAQINSPNDLTESQSRARRLKLEAAKYAIKLNGLETEQHLVAQVDREDFKPLTISRFVNE